MIDDKKVCISHQAQKCIHSMIIYWICNWLIRIILIFGHECRGSVLFRGHPDQVLIGFRHEPIAVPASTQAPRYRWQLLFAKTLLYWLEHTSPYPPARQPYCQPIRHAKEFCSTVWAIYECFGNQFWRPFTIFNYQKSEHELSHGSILKCTKITRKANFLKVENSSPKSANETHWNFVIVLL